MFILSFKHFVAGWVGGLSSLLVGHPFDTIKVRQQTFGGTMRRTLMNIIRYEGIRGLYKGMMFPFIIGAPSNSVFFGVYGNILRIWNVNDDKEYHKEIRDKFHRAEMFCAGCIAGSFQICVTCPADVVKTLLQTDTKTVLNSNMGSSWNRMSTKKNRAMELFTGILKKRGIRGLFRGFIPMCIRDIPTSGLYVLTYETMFYSVLDQWKFSDFCKQMIAGGSAGICAWILVFPVDVVKSRMQSDDPVNPKYKGMMDCIKKSYKSEGVKVFTKGFPVILIRSFPSNAAVFVGFECVLAYWDTFF